MLKEFKNNLKSIIVGSSLILISIAIFAIAIKNTAELSATKDKILSQALLNVNSNLNSDKITTIKNQNVKLDLKNLRFTQVERHEVPNAKATVVYIPQLHREPTSTPEDPKNNQAYSVQKEISGMLTQMSKENGVNYAMDETDLYGPLPQDKIAKIKNGVAAISDFKKNLEISLTRYVKNGGSQSEVQNMRSQALNQIAPMERRLYLTGGAAVFSANPGSYVYGSQDKATIQLASQKLQNLSMMEKRIAQLESGQGQSVASASQNNLGSLAGLMGNRRMSTSIFSALSSTANSSNDIKMLDAIKAATNDLQILSSMSNFESAPTSQQANNSDTYQNRNDLAGLKSEYTAAQADFMKIAKDQRSQEVSDNIENMMAKNNIKASALVFGYGHKTQLIEMLNAKGISVIVLTPVSENGAPPAP